jgi:pimeloyl-ACP methyl ester carboxylesterase
MFETVEDVVRISGGRQVGYMLRGPANGDVVVYLHGMPGCRREQRIFPDSVLERLCLRVLSIDRPEWGKRTRSSVTVSLACPTLCRYALR